MSFRLLPIKFFVLPTLPFSRIICLPGALPEGMGPSGFLMSDIMALSLHNNQIGDQGVKALARSVHAGALASCQELYLHLNQIGNEGMDSLAQSLKQGAMVSCRKLTTYSNPGNDLPVTKALKQRAEAAAAAEEQQAKVEKKVKKAAAA